MEQAQGHTFIISFHFGYLEAIMLSGDDKGIKT